jgi:hypothetical protein
MARQADAEVLDLADAFAREREDGVLLCIGWHDLAVVAGEVRLREIAGQSDADVDVLELVLRPGAVDADDMRLRLAVLVIAEDDGNAPL